MTTGSYDPLLRLAFESCVRAALEEDVTRGDLTTEACVDAGAVGSAAAVAREGLVVAGLAAAELAFRLVDPAVEFIALAADGDRIEARMPLFSVRGRARSLLMAERVALNFAQRGAGIASTTREYVEALPRDSKTRITDTRKTTPGLRRFERHAVRMGGGHNHRYDLASAVLIKDNHIAACGGITTAIDRARAFAPHTTRIECEVDSLDGLEEALAANADVVLLDNFSDADIARAVALRGNRRALLEASGGITLARVRVLGEIGVDHISVGALTHSVRARDIGLDWVPPPA